MSRLLSFSLLLVGASECGEQLGCLNSGRHLHLSYMCHGSAWGYVGFII